MKQNLRLLLPILSILLTLACLGTPTAARVPDMETTSASPSPIPSATANPFPNLGITVAYILDGNIWLWDGSAPARQLTSDGDATQVKISDDGAVIVYQRGQSLWAINADGSSLRLLVNLPVYTSPNPSYLMLFFAQFEFQINTHWIYFSTARKEGIYNNDLYRVYVDSPTPQTLLAEDGGQFTFSPDGNRLALSSLKNIKVIHADGSGLVTVLSFPIISKDIDYQPQVVWLSNGTGFYTVIPGSDDEKSKYLFVSADGSFSAQLAEYEAVPIYMSAPSLSPDGLKVAYLDQTATFDHLHVIEASTTDTIIASYEKAPFLYLWNWSPDSKRVTFSNAHPVLLLTAGIGIPPSPLTESVSPYSLRWISADRFIFFREGELLIGQINNPETISIASGFANDQSDTKHYDFTVNSLP